MAYQATRNRRIFLVFLLPVIAVLFLTTIYPMLYAGWLSFRNYDLAKPFIPRIFGWLLLVAGAGYVVSSMVSVALPQFSGAVSSVTLMLAIGELPIIFWLAIWGARSTAPMPAAV